MSDDVGAHGGGRGTDHAGSAIERARRVWSTGSYESFAPHFLPMAAHLVRTAGVAPDDAVLDVACGTGNVAITAARRGAAVTGLDVTPSMLEAARAHAATAGVADVSWRQGDAAALPFPDDAFDVTLSCVGHVFATPPDAVADELLRVTRPGGRIGFTSWAPGSVVPAMAGVVAAHRPPDPDPSPPPVAWGDPDVVRERLGQGVDACSFETGSVRFDAVSPAHYWTRVARDSGLFVVAMAGVDEAARPALRRAGIETVGRYFDDGANAVRMDYVLATATTR